MGTIYADVVARLDERAAQIVSDQLSRELDDMGQRVNAGLSTQMAAVSRGASAMGASVGRGALVAGSALAGVVVAAAEVGEALYGVGERFDAVGDSIAVRTGKIGEDLDGLSRSIGNVAAVTASSIEDIADIGARVSQAFDLSGRPFEDLTKQIADLNRMTGETLNIRQFGMTLRGFGDDGAQATQALDQLTAVSQRTGIPLNELVNTLGSVGPAARTLGLDMEDAAGLIVSFEEAGIDADKTVQGLNRAAATFAENNINLSTGLADTITQIRGFITAGDEAAAVDLAGKVFGTRAAQTFVDTIRQGTLNVDTLHQGLGNTSNTISKLDQQTADWAENWTILKNRVSELANMAGGPLFDALNKALGVLNNIIAARVEIDGGRMGPHLGVTPVNPLDQLAPGVSGPAPTGPTVPPVNDLYGPDTPPWLTAILPPPPPPGGYPAGPAPQDIAGALADKEKGAGPKGPRLPPAPSVPYDLSLPPGIPGMPPDASVFGAESSFLDARQKLAEKRARLTQLEHTEAATADEVQNARNDVIESERDLQAAEMRMGEARATQYEQLIKASEKHADQMKNTADRLENIGAQLDSDFGVSEGLAGIFDNITRFVANLAFAPAYGALSAVSEAAGYGPGEVGGGLVGAAAGAGVFGQQYQVLPWWMRDREQADADASAIGPTPLGGERGAPLATGSGSTNPNVATMEALAQHASGGQYDWGGTDLVNGLADCSGAVSELVAALTGRGTGGGRLFNAGPSTAADLEGLGFQPGFQPGAMNVGWRVGGPGGGHMAATLPSGTNFEAGGGTGGIAYGGPAVGAASFPNQMYLPVGGGASAPAATGGGFVPLSGDALTNPALTPPSTQSAGGGTGWWPSLTRPGGGGGGGAGTGMLGPGLAGPPRGLPSTLGLSGRAAPSQSVAGGRAFGQGLPASGGIGFGGGLVGLAGGAAKSAIAAGGLAADAGGGMGGGSAGAAVASAFADIGIAELQRAAGAAGQYVGALAGGALETFSLNQSALADPGSSWLGRLAIAAAGARPALPNTAGEMGGQENPNMIEGGKPQPPGPMTPQEADAAKAGAAEAGAGGADNSTTFNNNVTINNPQTKNVPSSMGQAQNALIAQQAARQPR